MEVRHQEAMAAVQQVGCLLCVQGLRGVLLSVDNSS